MKKKSESVKMVFGGTILDESISQFIKEESERYESERWDNIYHLTIYFNSNDITEKNLKSFPIPYKRPWHDTGDFFKRVELALRIAVTNIKNQLEDCYFEIAHISVEGKSGLKSTEIYLEKIGEANFSKRRIKSEKIHLDIELKENQKIVEIVDSINFSEWDFYIDERNHNKRFYNELLLKKEQNQELDISSLTEYDWKQLVLKEKVTMKEIAMVFDEAESTVNKLKKKFIPSVKQFDDEYLLYYVMIHQMIVSDYCSNFCIPLLEQMKANNVNVVYEYLNLEYHELFNTSEELKRQKEIEKNNLAGKEYVMPLSGILLKKLYWAVKNHQLDRKILKNNWFNTYYGPMFLKGFLERIEESRILELYESGEVYKDPSFEPYQELYRKMDLKESEDVEESEKILTKVETGESKTHIKKKKTRKICPPRDYVKLTKIKGEVGKTGQDLVYQYEWNALKDYPDLQKNIKKMYEIDESAGYDIESYDYDGNRIYIEVKTNKSDGENRIHFHISKTEDEFIANQENAYIYYVYDLENPKLRVIEQSTYLNYYKKAIEYEVDQEAIKE